MARCLKSLRKLSLNDSIPMQQVADMLVSATPKIKWALVPDNDRMYSNFVVCYISSSSSF
jgi:hypothetical protein